MLICQFVCTRLKIASRVLAEFRSSALGEKAAYESNLNYCATTPPLVGLGEGRCAVAQILTLIRLILDEHGLHNNHSSVDHCYICLGISLLYGFVGER